MLADISHCLLIIYNSQPFPDFHCCLDYEKIPFKVYLINLLRLKVIQEKNRFDFGFGWRFFFPEKLSAAYVGGDECV